MVNAIERSTTPRRTGARAVEDIAIETGVPVNVLLALGETAGARDDDELERVARGAATEIGPRLRNGETIDAIIGQVAGDRAESFMQRARAIGAERYPAEMQAARAASEQQNAQRQAPAAEDEPGIFGDSMRSVGAGIVEGAGDMARGAGILADQIPSLIRGDETYTPGMLARAGETVGNWAHQQGQALREQMSAASQQAMADSTPTGEIFSPSTWSLGEDPSLRGYFMHFNNVLGSLAPVLATAWAGGAVAGGAGRVAAVSGGVAGGAQAAGEGANTAAQIVDDAYAQRGEDGRSQLEASSPFFQQLRAQGMSEEQAYAAVRAEAERFGALFQAPIGTLSGAFIGTAARGMNPILNRAPGGPLSRALQGGLMASAEEGISEAGESMAARYGTQVGSGMPVDIDEGTFGDFVLGALGGAPVGAAGGAMSRTRGGGRDDEQESGTGMVSPEPGAPGSDGAFPVAPEQGAQDPAQAAGRTNVPVRVQLRGEPEAWDAEIIGETEDGIEVRSSTGDVYTIPRADIEAGLVSVSLAGDGAGAGGDLAPVRPAADTRGQGQQAGATEAPRIEQDADGGPLTVDAARRMVEAIEARARQRGWDDEAAATRAQLRAYIDRAQAQGGPAEIRRDEPNLITKRDGTPFGDEKAATRALGRLGFSLDTHEIVPSGDGFVARPKEGDADVGSAGSPGAAVLDDPQAGNPVAQGIGNDLQGGGEIAAPMPAADEGQGGDGGGSADGIPSQYGLDDATPPGEPGVALNEEPAPLPEPAPAPPAQPPQVEEPAPAPTAAAGSWRNNADLIRFKKAYDDPYSSIHDMRGGWLDDVAQYADWLGGLSDADLDKIAPHFRGFHNPFHSMLDLANGRLDEARSHLERAIAGQIQTNGEATGTGGQVPPNGGQGSNPTPTPLATAIGAGPVEHVTKKGKTLTGYIIRGGMTLAEVKKIDPYAFKKDGGIFIRQAPADAAAAPAAPAQQAEAPAARPEPTPPETPDNAIDAAAAETDPNPTPAQAEAENYKTGKADWKGLKLSVENAKGSERRGTGKDGKEWSVTMPAHYGRILRTEGADGDHVDFYMGDSRDSESVWVVDQMDPETGRFDEHKVMLGFSDGADASETYKAAFSDGSGDARIGGIKKMSLDDFKDWLATGDQTKPVSPKAKRADAAAQGAADSEKPAPAAGPKIDDSDEMKMHEARIQRLSAAIEGNEFTARNIREALVSRGMDWSKIAFQFRVEEPSGGYHFEWFTGDGKFLAKVNSATSPAAIRRREIDDPLSSYTTKTRQQIERMFASLPDVPRQGFVTDAAQSADPDPKPAQADSPAEPRPVRQEDATFSDAGFRVVADGQSWAKDGNRRGGTGKWVVRKLPSGKFRVVYFSDQVGSIAIPAIETGIYQTPAEVIAGVAADGSSPANTTTTPTKAPDPATERRPLDPQPKGPRRLDWWWTNNAQQRFEALGRAGIPLDGNLHRDTFTALMGKITPDQHEALMLAVFGPEAETKPKDGPRSAPPPVQESPKQKAPAKKPGLKGLTEAENAELEALEALFIDKMRNQLNSGLDPEMVSIAFKIGSLYVKAGTRRFRALIDTMMQRLGMTLEQAQPYARSAYNQIRGDMDLAGEDIADMDSDQDVIAEIRKMRAEASRAPLDTAPSNPAAEDDIVPEEKGGDDDREADSQLHPDGLEGSESELGTLPGGRDHGDEPVGQGGEPDQVGDEVDQAADGSDLVGDGAGNPDDAAAQRGGENPGNFVIEPDFPLGEGKPSERIAANIEAIRIVKALEAENRYATKEEQYALARYVGWGGLKRVFDARETGKTTQFGRAQATLREILTRDEYRAAALSTENAHYTSRTVVNAMWATMNRFGFKGGRVLEPTVGTGNFLGLSPWGSRAEFFGAELDTISGLIAKHLYPNATIFDGRGFEDAPFRAGTMDIAIGNPPFSSTIISSKMHPEIPKLSLHNYIIAKSGVLLRPGGIMGMVVTSRFLDTANPQARTYLARHFDFIGAVRMPNTAFKANAGTEVTTDIVWFQKRAEGEPRGDLSWLETDVALGDGSGVKVNGYFAANPEMMLGRPGMDGTMYGGKEEFTLHDDGRDFKKALSDALGDLDAKIGERTEQLEDAVFEEAKGSNLAIGEAMLTPYGKVVVRGDDDANGNARLIEVDEKTPWGPRADDLEGVLRYVTLARDTILDGKGDSPAEAIEAAMRTIAISGALKEDGTPKKTAPAGMGKAALEAITTIVEGITAKQPAFGRAQQDALTALADAVDKKRIGKDKLTALKKILRLRRDTQALLRAEADDAPEAEIEAAREKLAGDYRAFIQRHGYLSSPSNDALIMGIPGAESGLEVGYKPKDAKSGRPESAQEASILSQRIITPYRNADSADSVADAVHITLRERGMLDIPHIAKLTGSSIREVIEELTDGRNPLAFRDPATGNYVMADEYLSGNIAQKIEQAIEAGEQQNVRHLREAMPAPKTAEQISPSIQSMWIPEEVFEDFARALGAQTPKVRINARLGTVSFDEGRGASDVDFGRMFATESRTAMQIFDAALRGKSIVVMVQVSRDKSVKDEAETQAANAAAARMAAEFEKWVFANPERKQKVVDAFNEKVNVVVQRKFDGVRYFRPVGINPKIDLRDSQKNGAWRMMQSKATMLHHVVGAGKTFTAIAGIMERRRLGLSKKAVVAVPNHITSQWARDFYALYPGANVMVATEKDFEKSNRRRLIARIATGDFDAVVIGHSSLKFMENNAKMTESIMQEQLDDLEDALMEAKRNGESGRNAAQIQKRIDKYRAQMEKTLADIKADTLGFDFSHMGIDTLVIDEAHEFKNLEYATSKQRVVGMNAPEGSQRALDLYIKTRSTFAAGGSVHMLTGTPVSNSLVELFTFIKFMAPDTMRSMSLSHFDAFASAFLKTETRFEYTPAMKLKERNVLKGVINLGPLSELWRSFSDVLLRADVERIYTEQMERRNAEDGTNLSTRFPTPKVKGGGRRLITIPTSPDLEEFTDYLVMRMEGIKRNASNPDYMKLDNPLWVLSDARKASIDIRTINPSASRSPLSKVVVAGDEILRIYRDWTPQRGAQMVFADSSVPNKMATGNVMKMAADAFERSGMSAKDARSRVKMMRDRSRSWHDIVVTGLRAVEAIIEDGNLRQDQVEKIETWLAENGNEMALVAVIADSGFSFYDDLKAYLVENGIPEDQIAFIHDFGTSEQKSRLFDRVNAGEVRVLIGSTFKMGAGTNAQERLVALHHIDAPWRPSDMEQREGRIIRQGNKLFEDDPDGFEVEIIAYANEKTSDVVLWQVLERKASGIEQFLNASADSVLEDGESDADSYAQFMAQSTGNRIFLDKMEAEKALRDMQAEQASVMSMVSESRQFLASMPKEIAYNEALADAAASIDFSAYKDAGSAFKAFQAERTEYEAAKREFEEAAAEVRAANDALPEGAKRQKLPSFERVAPSLMGRDLDPYNAALKRAFEQAMDRVGSSDEISIGEKVSLYIDAEPGRGETLSYAAYLRIGNTEAAVNGSGTSAKNPAESVKAVAALQPDYLKEMAADHERRARRRVERLKADEPVMRRRAEMGIDRKAVESLKRRLGMLTGLVRIAEVKQAAARIGRPNIFAQRDDKGRSLAKAEDDLPLKPKDGLSAFVFTNAGMTYTARIGAVANNNWAYFDAEDADGNRALIAAKREMEGVTETWVVDDVYDMADVEVESRIPATDSAAFKRWFGKSKVVDERGNPLVVYHGTAADDFSAFKPGSWFSSSRREASAYTFWTDVRRRDQSTGKFGIARGAEMDGQRVEYFGTIADVEKKEKGKVYATDQGVFRYAGKGKWEVFSDLVVDYDTFDGDSTMVRKGDASRKAKEVVGEYEQAVERAYPMGEGGRVYPAYLSIKNPVRLSPFEANRIANRLGMNDAGIQGVISEYEALGYDGIETQSDEQTQYPELSEDGKAAKQWIAFRPEQVKSTFNRGTFDPDDPRMQYSRSATAPAGWGEVDADPEPSAAEIAAIARDVAKEMAAHGLAGKVTAEVVKEIRKGVFGLYTRAVGRIRVKADRDLDTIGLLHHEIVHALRDMTLWGAPYGLFTQDEWRGLVRAARDDRALIGMIQDRYPDLTVTAQMEEAVAEMYRLWVLRRGQRSGVAKAFGKVRAFFTAMANAFRGRGFQSAALTLERIAGGTIGGRGPDGSTARDAAAEKYGPEPVAAESRIAPRRPDGKFTSKAADLSEDLLGGGRITADRERGILGKILTDAMGGKSGRYSILGLVPGEPLYQELAKDLPSARTYLRNKHAMSAMRNARQAEAAKILDQWRGFMVRHHKANTALMELMHDATIAGIDPAEPFTARQRRTHESDADYQAFLRDRMEQYRILRERWNKIPKGGQDVYRKVRDAYIEVARDERQIIEDNVTDAMDIALKRARLAYEDAMRRLDEDGVTGPEREVAEAAAEAQLAAVKKRNGYGRAARLRSLRLLLEQNRVEAPYFPLLRHGQYFVMVKDQDGKVVSFSKAESERQQSRIAREARRDYPGHEITTGLMDSVDGRGAEIDPNFVADIEDMVGSSVDDPALMDAIWQRYLETLPDFSIRKSRLHRKGTPGFSRDAFRSFARQMFHSAHQLARLKHSMKMQMALDDARREVGEADDPNRAGAVVNEMVLRHAWIMNPQSSGWSTWATSAAFVYYLGATPAAAAVNLTQTAVVGVPVLAAAFEKGGALRASRQLMRALRQFTTGMGSVERSKSLTEDERAAIHEAYQRGIIDKSQSHDLAGMAEAGVEYSDIRQRVMAPISFFFHHAERLNREITFLAAYRMARDNGMDPDRATEKAGELTWKAHFNYESDSRPRLQHNDFMKVLTVFRNFQLNMLYRLFRDTHQAFKGRSEAERREARAQLTGISGMMLISAGVTGTWGFSLLMTLGALFFPGDSDDLEKELKNGLVNTLGRDLAGLILNGVPGHLTGIDLSSRIGMPELWFRSPDRQLEGEDLYNYWAQQFLGAVPGMIQNVFRGVDMISQGRVERGIETMAPKVVRDLMRSARYIGDGVTTSRGNTILENVSPAEALTQALGFTPARIAERYETNSWLMNANQRIQDERGEVLNAIWAEVGDGGEMTDRTRAAIDAFNAANPDYRIDDSTIRRSMSARRRYRDQSVGGVLLNRSLNERLRAQAPISIYDTN